MAQIWNLLSREKSQNDPFSQYLDTLSDDEKIKLRNDILQQKINQPRQDDRMSRGLGYLSNVFAQRAGLKPQSFERPQNDLNDFIERMIIKQKIEESSPIKQAQIAAQQRYAQEYGGEEVIPTNTVKQEAIPQENIPTQAVDNDYYMKPIIKNVAGVPSVIGYEKKLTEEGKINKKIKFEEEKKFQQLKVEAETDMNQVKNMLDSAWNTADKLIPAPQKQDEAFYAGLKRDIGTAKVFGKIPAQAVGMADENAIAYKSFVDGTVSMIIRGLGEKGVLNYQDIQRAYNLLPQFNDTVKVRTTKKEQLRNFLSSKVDSFYNKRGDRGISKGSIQKNEGSDYQTYLQEIGQ